MKLNKKISTEAALGIIGLIALILGYEIWQGNVSIPEGFNPIKLRLGKKTEIKSEKIDPRVLFATNGQRDIYKMKKDDKWVVIIDGQESQAFDNVSAAAFSADGTQFAYVGTDNSQDSVYLDNKVYDAKKYGSIVEIIFSPNGDRIAYKVTENGKSFIVINGQEGKKYDNIYNFIFSEDGKQFAYQASNNGQQIVVVNNNQEIANNSGSTGNTNNTNNNNTNVNYGTPEEFDTSIFDGSSSGRDLKVDQNRLFYPVCTNKNGCNF